MGISQPLLLDLPMPICTARLVMRPLQAGDGAALFAAIEESIDQLRLWLPWARGPSPSEEELEIHARRFYIEFLSREALHLAVYSGKELIGMCGLKNLRWDIPSCELGYWFRTTAHRKGFATEAVNAITRYAFSQMGMHRFVITCDDENTRSAAIPERLGFTLEMKAKGIVPLGPTSDELRTGRLYSRLSLDKLPELAVSWQ